MSIAQTGGVRYGFEITSVQTSNTTTGAGTFTASTGINVTSQSGRSYARHNPKNSSGSWSVTWTAPSTNVGSVRFYAAGVSANNASGASGDKTYAQTMDITALSKISFTILTQGNKCPGDSTGLAKLTGVSGGAGAPYQYAWSANNSGADSAIGLWSGSFMVTVFDKDSNMESKAFSITNPTAVSAIPISNPTICNDSTGSLSFSLSGGTKPYQIGWPTGLSISNDTAFNLKKGGYQVTITDSNNCVTNALGNVIVSGSIIKNSITVGNDYCENAIGKATINSTSGHAGNLTYAWSDGSTLSSLSGLIKGTYYLTVTDDSNCMSMDTIIVSSMRSLDSISLYKEDDRCNDSIGIAAVQFSNGALGGLTYLWSNGERRDTLKNLGQGKYVVTVTDSVNCSITDSVFIANPHSPVIGAAGTDLICFGDSSGGVSTMVSRGVPPYSFMWSNGSTDSNQTGLNAGVYTVTVTDANSCQGIDSALVMQPEALQSDSVLQTSKNENGDCNEEATIWVSGGIPPYSFLWSNGSTDSIAMGLCDTTYTVQVTDANGCLTDTNIVVNDYNTVGIAESLPTEFLVYPNPATTEVFIRKTTSGIYGIELYTIAGELVLNIPYAVGQQMVNLEEMIPGKYVMIVRTGDSRVFHPLVIQ